MALASEKTACQCHHAMPFARVRLAFIIPLRCFSTACPQQHVSLSLFPAPPSVRATANPTTKRKHIAILRNPHIPPLLHRFRSCPQCCFDDKLYESTMYYAFTTLLYELQALIPTKRLQDDDRPQTVRSGRAS